MLKHGDLLSGSDEFETVEDGLYEVWKENKW
jgi:hypothetical protein